MDKVNFITGGLPIGGQPADIAQPEETDNTTPSSVAQFTAKDKQLMDYADKVEDKHGADLVAPSPNTVPSPNTDWEADAEKVKAEKNAKIDAFSRNQNYKIDKTLLLKAGKAGRDKGLTPKQTEQKLREKGFQIPDGAIRDSLLEVGLKHGVLDKVADSYNIPTADTSPWQRAGQEMIKIGAEATAGVTSLTNETELHEKAINLAKTMEDKETAWKNQNSILDADGKIDRPWNVAGGAAEAGTYATIGAVASLPTTALRTAALADFMATSSLDTARYLGSDKIDAGQYAVNIGANLLGFGLATKMFKGEVTKGLENADIKAFNDATTEQKAYAVSLYDWAKKNDIDLLSSDVNDFDTTANMFLEESKKNFTTASVMSGELQKNLHSLVKVTHNIMGSMANAKELTPNVANNVKQSLLNIETDYDNKISQAYKELADADPKTATLPSDALIEDYRKSSTYSELANTKAGRLAIKNAESLALDDGKNYAPSDLYALVKSVNNLAYSTDDKTLASAYTNLSSYLEDRMGKLAKLQGSDTFMDKLKFARGLAKEKGDIFGFNKSRTGAVVSDIPKLIKEDNPDKVMDILFSNPRTFKAIDAHLPVQVKTDLQDYVKGSLLQKHTQKGKTTAGSLIDFSGLAKDIDKMDIRTMKELFGNEETLNLQLIASVGKILGKQYDTDVAGGNVLGALGEKRRIGAAVKDGFKGMAEWASDLLVSRKSVRALVAKDKAKLAMNMEKLKGELKETGIQDPKNILNKVVNSIEEVKPIERIAREKEDYGDINDMVNTKPKSEIASKLKIEDKEIKAQTRQVQNDYTRANEAITAEARAHGFSPELKQEYNELRQAYTQAKHQGDLSRMSETSGKIDDLYDRVVANNIKRAEKLAQAKIDRLSQQEERARKRAERARLALHREANSTTQEAREKAESDLLETSINREVAEAERDIVVQRARNLGSTLPKTVENLPKEIASKTNKFVASLGDGWKINNVRGNNEKHIYLRNSIDGSSFVVHLSRDGKRLTATTTGLNNGSGVGGTVYPALWDYAKSLGATYQPDNILLTANPVRMTYNMLKYMTQRSGDAKHILVGRSQVGATAGRGSVNLTGKPLTRETARKLVRQFARVIKSRTGVEITGNMTNKEIARAGRELGSNSNYRLGKKSIRLLNKLMSPNQTMLGMAGILAILSQDKDLEKLLSGSSENNTSAKGQMNSFLTGGLNQ